MFSNKAKTLTLKNLTMTIQDLFSNPISKTKVRKDIFAYRYANGCVNIQGKKYFGYSIKNAISLWRKEN